MDDIIRYLALIRDWTSRADWSLPETEAARICRNLAGEKRASEIGKIDLAPYSQQLAASLARAYDLAGQTKAQAVYFEYDLDNGWESNFFLCPTYVALADVASPKDDDWACNWVGEFSGPSHADLTSEYSKFGFDGSPEAIGSTVYLVGRTISAFGAAFSQLPIPRCAVCIAFHDQSPVLRLHEPPKA